MFVHDEQREPVLGQCVYSPEQLFRRYPVDVQVGGHGSGVEADSRMSVIKRR
jgi:hypothetical protein